MKVRVNPLVSILLIVFASSLLLYLLQRRQENTAPAEKAFVQAAIRGRLTFKSLRSGIQSIRVDNDSQTFRFRTAVTPGGAFFHAYAEPGDSIIKMPGANAIAVKGATGTEVFSIEPTH